MDRMLIGDPVPNEIDTKTPSITAAINMLDMIGVAQANGHAVYLNAEQINSVVKAARAELQHMRLE